MRPLTLKGEGFLEVEGCRNPQDVVRIPLTSNIPTYHLAARSERLTLKGKQRCYKHPSQVKEPEGSGEIGICLKRGPPEKAAQHSRVVGLVSGGRRWQQDTVRAEPLPARVS